MHDVPQGHPLQSHPKPCPGERERGVGFGAGGESEMGAEFVGDDGVEEETEGGEGCRVRGVWCLCGYTVRVVLGKNN